MQVIVKCPHCGATLSVPDEYKDDKRLHCSQCDQIFDNKRPVSAEKKSKKTASNEMSLKGKIITTIIIFALAFWGYGSCQDNIKTDGNTVYVITKDIYAPSTEEAAKKYIGAISENGNDAVGLLEYLYENSNSMTHLFKGDKVVVVKYTSSGYKVRKLSDFQTAIVPNESYLRRE